jgi:hypothetical protein
LKFCQPCRPYEFQRLAGITFVHGRIWSLATMFWFSPHSSLSKHLSLLLAISLLLLFHITRASSRRFHEEAETPVQCRWSSIITSSSSSNFCGRFRVEFAVLLHVSTPAASTRPDMRLKPCGFSFSLIHSGFDGSEPANPRIRSNENPIFLTTTNYVNQRSPFAMNRKS